MLGGLKASLASMSWGDRVLLGVLLLYGLALWILRPLTPFEQDEVLFLRGLEKYDVARHAPHPPGYPLYIGIGKAFQALTGDPVTALQLVSVLAAVLTVGVAWVVARRLGAARAEATTGAAVLAAVPAFLFHSNVGFSDVAGTALALAAAWALLSALENAGALSLAGAAAAAAVAVRPQVLVFLVPLGLAAVVVALRGRRWLALASAVSTGLGVTLMCWVPAVLVTGPGRFRQALVDAGRWVAEHETRQHLPGAPLTTVAHQWLVNPWGTLALAVAFWLLVAVGAVVFWRSGRRRLVVVALVSAGFYAAVALWTLNMSESARYLLPALPVLTIVAGGVAGTRTRWLRPLVLTGTGVWCFASGVWLWPVLSLRKSEPAPVWEGLAWVAAHENPAVTTVVFDPAFRPHVGYVLSPLGFHVDERRREIAYANFFPGGSVVSVTREALATGEVLLDRSWNVPALEPFSRHYYERCVVSRARPGNSVRFSASFRTENDSWQLSGRGELWLPEGAPMQILRVPASDVPLQIAAGGGPELSVAPRSEAFVPLLPGHEGAVRVSVAGGGTTRLSPLELLAVGRADWVWFAEGRPGTEFLVPAAAHITGRMQAVWITDLLVRNPQPGAALELELVWSQEYQTNRSVLEFRREVPPAGTVLLRDVIAKAFRTSGRGGLRVLGSAPFSVLWRTYDARLPHTLTDPTLLRALRADEGVREGTFALSFRPGADGVRSNVGFFNPGRRPCEVRLALRQPGAGTPFVAQTLHLPPLSFDLRDADELLGRPRSRTITAVLEADFVASEPVLAFASVIENGSNRSTYVFAGEPATPTPVPSAH